MDLIKVIANETVHLSADDAYEQEAQMVLDFVASSVTDIHAQTVVSFHYAFVTFQPIEEGYRLMAPCLNGSGVEQLTEDVSDFLQIIRLTFSLADRLNLNGELLNFHYRQRVIVAQHALSQSECYAHRYDHETWFIGAVDRSIPSQPLQHFEAHEIFAKRPEFYEVMHLPIDYIALFSQRQLISVLDLTGKDLLAKKDSEEVGS